MKVATKLSGAFVLHMAVLVGLLVYHVMTTRAAVETSYELSEIFSELYLSSTEQLDRINQLQENASKYVATHDRRDEYLDRFNQAFHAFDAALLHLDTLSLGEREHAELTRLAEGWASFRPQAERLPGLGPVASAQAAQTALAPLNRRLNELRLLAQGVRGASQAVMVARLEGSANAADAAERLSWGAAASALLLSLLVSGLIVRSISDPLGRLKAGTREVADGNFAYRLDADRGDEFADVSRDFNTMAQRLGELDQMKRDFVSKISHDLKTPLASMQETADILLDEVPGPLTEKQRRLLLLNHQSGQRLSSMVAKLLDLSGLEAGGFEPDLRTHELAPLVQRAVDQVEPATADRRLRVYADAPDQRLLVECDGERILQVLDNLLENALKFSPEGGTIRVAARFCAGRPDGVPVDRWHAVRQRASASGVVLLTVSDTGPGVPEGERERVFERFFQARAGRTARGRGVGLGLAICREIVVAHGGSIWVHDNPAGGSIFHVLLPGALRMPDPAAFALTTANERNGTYEI